VTSGNVYGFTGDIGYNFFYWSNIARVGGFAGFGLLHESLDGLTTGGTATTNVLQTNWQALRTGIVADWNLFNGRAMLTTSIAGLPVVHFDSGTFHADGSGVTGSAMLTFPLPNFTGLRGTVFVQNSYMKVSGDTTFGTPMDVKNNNLTVGAGLFWAQGLTQGVNIHY
jgi:hypothetical protein